jgi:hypothetical protein
MKAIKSLSYAAAGHRKGFIIKTAEKDFGGKQTIQGGMNYEN